MKTRIWKNLTEIVAASSALLLGSCRDEDLNSHVFEPLAKANIHVNGRVRDFDRIVDEFARKRGFIVKMGNYAKNDWVVDNLEIDVDKKRKLS